MTGHRTEAVSDTLESAFFPFELVRRLAQLPARSTDALPWVGHIPFARWLVHTAHPRSIVELGVFKGDSYCTFCESVVAAGLETKCTGIDLWTGDHQTGLYGDDLFEELRAYHDPLYGHFSQLVRTSFAEAQETVEDGSIDILHIDGLHTYDAVREDFETWLPKTSERGVILFHDIEVRRDDFGVWQLWAELTERYPSFAFRHSNGLGILATGKEPPAAIAWLTGLDEQHAKPVAGFFADLGARIEQDRAGEGRRAEVAALEARLDTQTATLHRLSLILNDAVGHMASEIWEGRLREVEAYCRHVEKSLAETQANARANEEALIAKIQEAEAALAMVHASTSWRVTAPLRATTRFMARNGDRFGFSGMRTRVRSLLNRVPGGPALIEQVRHARAIAGRNKGPKARDLLAAKEEFRRNSEAEFAAFLASEERLRLPCSARPVVTVLLVLWNQAALTLACLKALASEFDVALEVVIVDNASSDQTGALLSHVEGARLIRENENLGFLKAVNKGLAAAQGRHVLLLNNDAVLRPGSLRAAVEAIESADDIGAVGGRIILPSGRLQEAGSIIWQDGSCHGYGRDDDPEAGAYMFRRDVDYCSGAFLLVRRDAFERLGGFDEIYAPAYYEETDLCMRLWAEGLRVVYEPQAVIDHFEFGSSEKSETALELQRRNQAIFRERHAERLEEHHRPDPANILHARMRDDRPRILFVEDRVPLATLGSGFPRARDILDGMREAGDFVTFYPATKPYEDWPATWQSIPGDVEVAMGHGLPGLEAFLDARRGYYTTLFVSRPHNMETVARIRKRRPELFAGLVLVYDAEAVFASRDASKARLLGDDAALRQAEKAAKDELALANAADRVVAVSQAEASQFEAACGAEIHIMGHALEPAPTTRAFADRRHALFVGALDHEDSPNVDSLVWFADEVMPKLETKLGPQVGLVVVGRNGAPSVQARANPRLMLEGAVDDLAGPFSRARVFVAPTRYAAGIPHKVHQAAAYGVPVVATSLLADQLGWRDGIELLVADDAQAFADAVARLYEDESAWHKLRDAALQRVRKDCDPAVFQESLKRVIGSAS